MSVSGTSYHTCLGDDDCDLALVTAASTTTGTGVASATSNGGAHRAIVTGAEIIGGALAALNVLKEL